MGIKFNPFGPLNIFVNRKVRHAKRRNYEAQGGKVVEIGPNPVKWVKKKMKKKSDSKKKNKGKKK